MSLKGIWNLIQHIKVVIASLVSLKSKTNKIKAITKNIKKNIFLPQTIAQSFTTMQKFGKVTHYALNKKETSLRRQLPH